MAPMVAKDVPHGVVVARAALGAASDWLAVVLLDWLCGAQSRVLWVPIVLL
jgi:hypothetical protein